MTSRNYTPLPPIREIENTTAGQLFLSSDVNTMSVDELKKFIQKEMIKLSRLQDMNKKEADAHIANIYNGITRARNLPETAIYDFCVEVEFLKLYRKIIKNHFDEILDSNNGDLYSRIKLLISLVWNSSDKSEKFCDEFLKIGLHKDYVTYLKTDFFSNAQIFSLANAYVCKAFLSSLHNTLQKSSLARDSLRSVGAVEVFQTFRSSSNQMASCLAIMSQAYMVTEAENDQLNSDKQVFEYLLNVLNSAIKGVGYQGATFCVEEVLDAINKLAANDNNKKLIIDAGGLNYYVKFLKHEHNCSPEATAMAAHGIWILGFKCKDDIIRNEECMTALKNLLSHSNESIRKEAEGALWILEEKATNTSREEDKSDRHIFISYQWDSKKTVLKVRDHLKRAGIKTWIDEDDMSGSLLEAMATAVEKASVVIICLSQRYKDSPNCRTEAEYTFRLRKPVIPLRLQSNYQPDGWLGILVGSKLYFDVSLPAKYDDSVRNLLKEIEKFNVQGHGTNEIDAMDGKKKNVSTHEMSNPVRKWTREDIDDWIERNKIGHMKKIFEKFDGDMLVEYAQMKEEAPDAFYLTFTFKNFDIYDSLLVKKALKEI